MMNLRKGNLTSKELRPIGSAIQTKEHIDTVSNMMVIEACSPDMDLRYFIAANKEKIEILLDSIGAILFKGFAVSTIEEFHHAVLGIGKEPLEYEFGSTPRTEVSKRVYTSTEYPANQVIPMHNEMSYTDRWPACIWFYCELQAESGGETPIVDSRKVYKKLPANIREAFEREGVTYIRNYRDSVDLPWQKVFNTDDRTTVENYCRSHNINYAWNGDHLKTWQKCQATITFEKTGEKVWFNQAHLFHYTSLSGELRESLLHLYGETGMPRNTCFGNGEPISPAYIETITEAYDSLKVPIALNKHDVMLLNNLIIGHGRMPYTGDRKVRVAMTN